MADILNKSGTIKLSNIKDSWELSLEAGKQYKYEVKNTDNHGRFNLLIEGEFLNYGEVPISEKWGKMVKENVEPEDTDKGSFTAPRSVSGLNTNDPADQAALDKISYVRVSVKWITTVYEACYSVRIYE